MNPEQIAEFRFYAELNDFLPPAQRQQTLLYRFGGHPGIKDPIEVFGVPHPEVELILVNGEPVGFDYQLQADDRVAVYPAFKTLELMQLPSLRQEISPDPRFVLDVNLGRLSRFLRLLGFDSLYRNDYTDADVVKIAVNEQRIILTRDRRLLFAKLIDHGYWLRNVLVERQVAEVLHHFNLHDAIKPFILCPVCNGRLAPVSKADILDDLEPKTKLYYEVFHRCSDCGQIYWQGSHTENMRQRFAGFLTPSKTSQDLSGLH